MIKNNEILIKGLSELNVKNINKAANNFQLYYDLLIEWNKKMNLTTITEENEVIIKHFLDSIMLTKGRKVRIFGGPGEPVSVEIRTSDRGAYCALRAVSGER